MGGGLAHRVSNGRFRLSVPVEVHPDVSDNLAAHLNNDAAALKRFLELTVRPDTGLSDLQERKLGELRLALSGARFFPALEMLASHPGRRLDGSALLPAWTSDYTLTRRGWELRVPEVHDDWGRCWQQARVSLADTFTHRPRAGADAVQPVIRSRPSVEKDSKGPRP